jgi:hypothetical protein
MNKLFDETIQESLINENKQLFHINDVAHLIHNCISGGLKLTEFSDIKLIVIKFGNLFTHSNILLCEFYALLDEYEEEQRKPLKVAEHRWFSFFEAAKVLLSL